MAGVVFGLVSDRTKFYVSALCGLAGALVTLLLVPDISGLDLSEGAPSPAHCSCVLSLILPRRHPTRAQHLQHQCAVGSIMLKEYTAAVQQETGGG